MTAACEEEKVNVQTLTLEQSFANAPQALQDRVQNILSLAESGDIKTALNQLAILTYEEKLTASQHHALTDLSAQLRNEIDKQDIERMERLDAEKAAGSASY
ncbi:MAG: hypothetical protein CMF31_02845 [Kordiimonas sp.]|nr:hypothetical protein [Kordiimonas sp.]|tara:strand:- start:531 stop:836 length:306 start_codon:yes stop_codon:yes gene_type:complete